MLVPAQGSVWVPVWVPVWAWDPASSPPPVGLEHPGGPVQVAHPERVRTLVPLTALIRYQLEPDLDVGQTALQWLPLTVATTVTVSDGVSRVLIDALSEALVRMLTALAGGQIQVRGGRQAWVLVPAWGSAQGSVWVPSVGVGSGELAGTGADLSTPVAPYR